MYIPTTTLTQGGALKIFDSTLGADAGAIDTGANAIVGGYDVLELWVISRTTEAVVASSFNMTVNGDTGANYDFGFIKTTQAAVTGISLVAQSAWPFNAFGSSAQAGAATIHRMSFPGYAQTTFHKSGEASTTHLEDTAADCRTQLSSMRWRNTAAITQVTLTAGSGSLVAGSRLVIYLQ